MAITGKLLAEFMATEGEEEYTAAVHSAEIALRECGFPPERRADYHPLDLMRYRLRAQDRIISGNRNLAPRVRGIYYDFDNQLAMYYFALDVRLLAEVGRRSP